MPLKQQLKWDTDNCPNGGTGCETSVPKALVTRVPGRKPIIKWVLQPNVCWCPHGDACQGVECPKPYEKCCTECNKG